MRLASVLLISSQKRRSVLIIRGRHIESRPEPVIQVHRTKEQNAYDAWMMGGSMALGHWLADYKESTTGRRTFTVVEYGLWVDMVRSMEFRLTGENSEFCL